VNLRRGACVRAGTLPVAASVLTTEEFAGFPVDEMKPGAGEANDGRIGIGIRFVLRRGLRKPMLHVRAQPWTFEKDMSAHGRNMQNPRAGSPPYVCVVGGLRLARKALNLPHPGPGRGRLTGAPLQSYCFCLSRELQLVLGGRLKLACGGSGHSR